MEYKNLRPLAPEEVSAALLKLPGWTGDPNGLKRTVTFHDFRSAIQFMQSCVEEIDTRDHHPVWCNKYKSLEIHLDTFDAGHRVTPKDIDLADYLNRMLAGLEEKTESKR